MANNQTLARPYAKAAFAFAQEHKKAAEWADELAQLGMLVEVPEMQDLLRNPTVNVKQVVDIIKSCFTGLNESVQNFVQTLADNHRLLLLPAIVELFHQYKAEAERTMDVHVTSALPLDAQQKEQFVQMLSKRLQCNVNIICTTDSSLLGGAIIRAGDEVIDGSARGRLEQLADNLMNG
jgi:F-type H+-transporting ATPase subunit delta